MECDNNRLDGMCHLGVIQLNLVFIIFSFLCDMDVSSSRFQTPKTFDEEKECVINSVLKSTVNKNKWPLQIFREWQDQKALNICTIELGGLFKGEDIGVDVQELTASIEILNAEGLN